MDDVVVVGVVASHVGIDGKSDANRLLISDFKIDFVIVVERAGLIPRVALVGGENLPQAVVTGGPDVAKEGAEFRIAPGGGIYLRAGRKKSCHESRGVHIVEIELQGGMIVAQRYTA